MGTGCPRWLCAALKLIMYAGGAAAVIVAAIKGVLTWLAR